MSDWALREWTRRESLKRECPTCKAPSGSGCTYVMSQEVLDRQRRPEGPYVTGVVTEQRRNRVGKPTTRLHAERKPLYGPDGVCRTRECDGTRSGGHIEGCVNA